MTGLSGESTVWTVRLSDLARSLNRAAHFRELSEALLQGAGLTADTSVLLVLASEGGATLHTREALGPERDRLTQIDWQDGLTLISWPIRTATSLACSDIRVDGRAKPLLDAGLTSGRAACFPVLSSGTVCGALLLFQPVPGVWPTEMLTGLEAIAEMAGLALARLDLRGRADHQVRHLMALHEVSRLLCSSLESRTVLTLIVDVAMGLFDLDLCCVLLPQGEGKLTVEAARGLLPTQAGQIVCRGTPPADLLAEHGCARVAVLDIVGRHERIGYLIAGRRAGELDQIERGLLDTWASLAGVALENSRLLAESERVNHDAIALLGDLLATQDPRGTSRQVAECAAAIARHLGLSEAESLEVHLAAMLPEAGGMAQAVGHLPGGSQRFQRLRQVQEHRRERWDGAGSGQVRGEAIPLGARMIAVAEAYVRAEMECQEGAPPHAVTPMTPFLCVKEGAGTRYDPRVVGALERLVWSRLKGRPAAAAQPPSQPPPQPQPPPPAAPPEDRPAVPKPDLSPLTQREQEILALVSAGMSNREIAVRLYLSEATVKTHVSRVLQKLRLPDRTKAAVYVLDPKGIRN